MDAIKLLEQQHDEVSTLFKQIKKATASADKQRLYNTIADALAMHATIEEKIFYPAVKARRTEDILLESLEEHLVIKRLIADLLKLAPTDDPFDAKVKVLNEMVDHHVDEERTDLFPKVRRLFNAEQLEGLGEEMQSMMVTLEGTDARKHVPKETAAAPELP